MSDMLGAIFYGQRCMATKFELIVSWGRTMLILSTEKTKSGINLLENAILLAEGSHNRRACIPDINFHFHYY